MAALSVLLSHMKQDGLGMDWNPLASFSHDAVMIFFVLSGFIIYYSTSTRASTWQQYAVARLARIYSVAVPSVVFCTALALWLSLQSWFVPADLSSYTPVSWWHTLSTLLFLNESWTNEATLSLNSPYWSVCYEVWFYIIFGIWYFARGRLRWLLLAGSGTIAGPAIIVLFPVWLMGAWLASSGRYATHFSVTWAWIAFIGPFVLIAFIEITGLAIFIKMALHENVPGFWRLWLSQRFATDYVVGAALCLHITAFSSLPTVVQTFFIRQQKRLAILASFSYTLYLFHWPMTQLLGAYFPALKGGGLALSTALLVTILITCWAISWGTEKRLASWRWAFSRLFLQR